MTEKMTIERAREILSEKTSDWDEFSQAKGFIDGWDARCRCLMSQNKWLWEVAKEKGFICVALYSFSRKELEHIKGWIEWLLKTKKR